MSTTLKPSLLCRKRPLNGSLVIMPIPDWLNLCYFQLLFNYAKWLNYYWRVVFNFNWVSWDQNQTNYLSIRKLKQYQSHRGKTKTKIKVNAWWLSTLNWKPRLYVVNPHSCIFIFVVIEILLQNLYLLEIQYKNVFYQWKSSSLANKHHLLSNSAS